MKSTEIPDMSRFVALLIELEEELNWEVLGPLYCHEGGEDFFGTEQIEAIRDAGLRFAGDLAAEFEELEVDERPRSLYVGAAVAELLPALFEVLVLGHRVTLHNLPGEEAKEINRALAALESRHPEIFPRVTTEPMETLHWPYHHIWMTSVLSDPDHFPGIHNNVYGRTGARAAKGGDLGLETLSARRLVRSLIDLVAAPALFTTSDEEAPFLRDATARKKMRATSGERARLSAVVGDPIRIWRLFPS